MSVEKQTPKLTCITIMMRSVAFIIAFYNDELVTSGAPSAEMAAILFVVKSAFASFAFNV